jgi:hypothetical protein
LYSTACSNATATPADVWRQSGERVGRNRFIAPLARSRFRFFGLDLNSRPLAGNVQQVMSGERRNKPIATLRAEMKAKFHGLSTFAWAK